MIDNQTTIFDMLYPKKKITKPIRLIELFGGYGSQALALKYLGVPFEHWKICEWAVKSIQAYKDIHCNFDEYCSDEILNISKEEIIDFLYKKGISSNYNEPMTLEQIKRIKTIDLYSIYENIYLTHNLVNIQQVKGSDLEIVDTDKYEYIMTYSFPCQDLSLAGKGKGMSDTSTRSGLLWEVERILTECHELGEMPQILLMENVPQVHSEDNLSDFNKWKDRLEELGYKNYFQDLIATDYGIPQTRNRCFMISLLGDYSYTFPKPIPLKLKLKDMLEDNVDEKYYLSDKQLEQISHWNSYQNPLDNVMGKESISPTITTRIAESQDGGINASMKVYSDTLQNTTNLRIKNATSKGYLEATNGDGIDISSRMEYHRGTVQKGKTQTLTTSGGNDRGVVIINVINKQARHQQDIIQDSNGNARTLVCGTHGNGGHYTKTLMNDLRIRKLTPRECGRLMGVKDEDIDKITLSDSAKYHIFGDAIVVNVLMAIFKELI